MKENHHVHTTGSDGKLKPEELIKLAIKRKFNVLGIADQFPPDGSIERVKMVSDLVEEYGSYD